ncbi:MAG: hypothetical protein ACRDXE_08325, partial [Acidimicrobiales bacterium]
MQTPLPFPIPGVSSFDPGRIGAGVAQAAASSVVHSFTMALEGGTTWLVSQLGRLLDPSTHLDLGGPWFVQEMSAMATVMLAVVGPLLMAASIGAVLRSDPRRLARIWLVSLPLATVGTFVCVWLTRVAMAAVDSMSALLQAAQGNPDLLTKAINTMVRVSVSTGSAAIVVVVSLLILAGALAVWMELVLRTTVILIVVFFLPLGLAALVWPATAHIAKRLVEILVAVILSKFVIVAVLTLGADAIINGHENSGLLGAAMLLLAAFAPFTLLKLVPVVEAAAIAHMEGTARRPLRAASRAHASAARNFHHPAADWLKTRIAGTGGAAANDASPPQRTAAPEHPFRVLDGWHTVDGQPMGDDAGPGGSARGSGSA